MGLKWNSNVNLIVYNVNLFITSAYHSEKAAQEPKDPFSSDFSNYKLHLFIIHPSLVIDFAGANQPVDPTKLTPVILCNEHFRSSTHLHS